MVVEIFQSRPVLDFLDIIAEDIWDSVLIPKQLIFSCYFKENMFLQNLLVI